MTSIALADNQRIVVVGEMDAKFLLCNTLGHKKLTVNLSSNDDSKTVEGPVLNLFFKPDKPYVIGVVPHGIFSWNFHQGDVVPETVTVKTTSSKYSTF